MSGLVRLIGTGMVFIVLVDVFLTVLYPRSGKGWLSVPLNQAVWQFFRFLSGLSFWPSDRVRRRILAFCGPMLLVIIVLVWILLLLFGFALMVWPALGSAIQSSLESKTPTSFAAALYYSGYILTTAGFGDLVPMTDFYRILAVVEAALGFSIFTLTITYLVAIYGALTQRNVFALSLHHRTAQSANAAELIARLGACGDFSNGRQDIADLSFNTLSLLESHHAYPVLHYFRFQHSYYSLARIIFLTMDTVALLRSALNAEKYRSLLRSAPMLELEDGGQHLLTELTNSFLPKCFSHSRQSDNILRSWYYESVERLQAEGIETVIDLEAGAEKYLSLRRTWEPCVMTLTEYLAYDWCEIAPAERNLSLRNFTNHSYLR